MKKERKRLALENGRNFFLNGQHDRLRNCQGKLPSIAAMAAIAGVSPVTLWKAMKQLTADGSLTINTYEQPPENQSPPTNTNQTHSDTSKWVRVKNRIIKDILTTVYSSGASLPSVKELKQRYGVCFQTLKKVLLQLEVEGYLTPCKKTYAVRQGSIAISSRDTNKIALILAAYPSGKLAIQPRTEEIIRSLERECPKLNIQFDMLGYSMTPTGTQININGKLCAPLSVTDQYLGICLYRNGFDIITPHCISELGRKKRMVVFDDTGDLPMPGNKNNFIKKLTIVDNYKSGSDIGRMLLDLGHRTVAFVAPYHRNQWSIDRYNGLTETFRLAGITAGIKLVGDPNAVYDQDFAPEPANWLKSNPEFKKAVDQLIAECRKSLGAQSRVTDRLNALTYEIPIRIREQHLFKSCFDTAFNLSGVSAWVCMNDTIAIAAMEYLRSRNKQVPADISLIGFDDSPEGFAVGLTSYNFNHTGASQTMLTYLFSPHESYFGNLKAIPHEGFIANRTSVARV